MTRPRTASRRTDQHRIARRLAWGAALLVAGLPLAALAWLSAASVETTPLGAPTRLLLPVTPARAIALPINVAGRSAADGGSRVKLPGFLDGPVVRRHVDGWTATWFCEDRVHTTRGSGDALAIECAGSRHAFSLAEPAVPPPVAPMPGHVVVLSDLEGNVAFLDGALRELGITGPSGGWQHGDGQLVVLGDSVDRGRAAFAVLWRLHDLAVQAEAAGGAVRIVLGNHDQYLLRTNPKSAHPGHLYALNAMGGYASAFGADTVIGAWLRRQPVLLKLGDVLFAHAGISPDVAQAGLSVQDINAATARYWETAPGTAVPSPALDAALGLAGVTQYRGYLRSAEGRYPAASTADVGQVLRRFDAGRIVVAHTVVPEVAFLHDGQVIAVDVNDNASRQQALVFEGGEATIVDLATRRRLPETRKREVRGFSLLDPRDRRLLADMIADLRRLSGQPWPY